MAELLAAKSKIAELETQIASTNTSNKRARIEFEKDLDALKSEREVGLMLLSFSWCIWVKYKFILKLIHTVNIYI